MTNSKTLNRGLSVLLPVYIGDDPRFFAVALDSVISQTVRASEIVIIKDGLVQTALDVVIQDFCVSHPNMIKVIALPENVGMGKAMNVGLHECSHRYVARMDADDVSRPERFAKQLTYLENHPAVDVVGSFIEEFNFDPGDLGGIRMVPEEQAAIIAYARHRNPINHMSVMFKRDKAIAAGGYWQRRIFEDYNLWYQMLKNGCRFHNLTEVLVDVRIGSGMVKRRSGFRYFRTELVFFWQMYKDQYFKISFLAILSELSCRLIARVLPHRIINLGYVLLLRRSKSTR